MHLVIDPLPYFGGGLGNARPESPPLEWRYRSAKITLASSVAPANAGRYRAPLEALSIQQPMERIHDGVDGPDRCILIGLNVSQLLHPMREWLKRVGQQPLPRLAAL